MLATAPVAIPGIVLGVGVFLTYSHPQLMLYGTLWILLIAFLTIEMPAGYQQMSAAFHGIHPELEEASRILGASRLDTLRRITAPLLRTSVIATWCFVFIGTIRELSATILLTTANTKLVSVIIYDLNESGDLGAISVLGLMLLAVSFAVVFIANRLPVLGGPVWCRADDSDLPAPAPPALGSARQPQQRSHRDPAMSFLELTGLTKRYGSLAVVKDVSLAIDKGAAGLPARAVGLRQDHDAAPDRRLPGARRRRDPGRRAPHLGARRPPRRRSGATCR